MKVGHPGITAVSVYWIARLAGDDENGGHFGS
jgi:hypothetical protein